MNHRVALAELAPDDPRVAALIALHGVIGTDPDTLRERVTAEPAWLVDIADRQSAERISIALAGRWGIRASLVPSIGRSFPQDAEALLGAVARAEIQVPAPPPAELPPDGWPVTRGGVPGHEAALVQWPLVRAPEAPKAPEAPEAPPEAAAAPPEPASAPPSMRPSAAPSARPVMAMSLPAQMTPGPEGLSFEEVPTPAPLYAPVEAGPDLGSDMLGGPEGEKTPPVSVPSADLFGFPDPSSVVEEGFAPEPEVESGPTSTYQPGDPFAFAPPTQGQRADAAHGHKPLFAHDTPEAGPTNAHERGNAFAFGPATPDAPLDVGPTRTHEADDAFDFGRSFEGNSSGPLPEPEMPADTPGASAWIEPLELESAEPQPAVAPAPGADLELDWGVRSEPAGASASAPPVQPVPQAPAEPTPMEFPDPVRESASQMAWAIWSGVLVVLALVVWKGLFAGPGGAEMLLELLQR